MIASSRTAKVLALAVAFGAHGVLGVALIDPDAAMTEGAAGGADVRLGSAFADMSAGTLTAESTAEPVEPTSPRPATQESPTETARTSPQDETPRDRPRETPPEAPRETPSEAVPERAVQDTLRETLPETPALAPDSEPAPTPAARIESATHAAPDGATATPVETTSTVARTNRAQPIAAEQARPAEPAEPTTTQAETLIGEDPASAAVTRSARPARRSAEFEQAHKAETPPEPRAQPDPAPRQNRGNATQNARAGTAAGSETARQATSGAGGQSRDAGNAAASNYPGLVMRQISRAGRPRVRTTGAAVVAFSITTGGGLAGARIASSSGSSELDRAALRIVQRAAPFPRPPAGARRSFSIRIQGR